MLEESFHGSAQKSELIVGDGRDFSVEAHTQARLASHPRQRESSGDAHDEGGAIRMSPTLGAPDQTSEEIKMRA